MIASSLTVGTIVTGTASLSLKALSGSVERLRLGCGPDPPKTGLKTIGAFSENAGMLKKRKFTFEILVTPVTNYVDRSCSWEQHLPGCFHNEQGNEAVNSNRSVWRDAEAKVFLSLCHAGK